MNTRRIVSHPQKNNLTFLILTVTLTCQLLFFPLLSIFGVEYDGISESPIFAIFVCIFAFMSLLLCRSVFFRVSRVSFFLLFFLPLFFAFSYLLESPVTIEARRYFVLFYPLSFPAICIGVYLAFNNCLNKIFPWVVIVMIIQSIVLTLYVLLNLSGNYSGDESYLNYQYVSYLSGFAVSVNLVLLLFGKDVSLFGWQKKIFTKIVCFFLLGVQFAAIFFSGGRGGFVVAFVSLCVLMFVKLKRSKSNTSILFTFLFFCCCFIALYGFIKSDMFNASRIFSYIGNKGIDMSETSGRDVVYSSAINLIKEKPVFGYGFFKYYDLTLSYPHNIFLEFLLQRGFILLIPAAFFVIVMLCKFVKLCKKSVDNYTLLPFLIYCIVELQFSDTYFYSSFFWFCVSYIFCTSSKHYRILNVGN